MGLKEWLIKYALNLLFWSWILFLGGARRIEGTFASGFLLWFHAPKWEEETIKFYGWLCLIGTTIWFLIGLFIPDMRF